MVSHDDFYAFLIASFAIIIVPGPSVLFTLARGVAWGRAVAVLSVLGNTIGTFVLSLVIAFGLGPLLARFHPFSIVLQLAGGCYLMWLGVQAFRHRRSDAEKMTTREAQRPAPLTIVRQGFTVGILNPKSLVFFGAVFPHFVQPQRGNTTVQLVIFGAVFCVMAFLSDGTWGVIAGTAREWLSGEPRRLIIMRSVGALVMMGLGLLILLSAATA
jgi:threonine/homoserine/homoserine lactone efflux protein